MEIGDEDARLHQEFHCMVEDVLLERVGLQVRLDSTFSQFLGARSSLSTVRERIKQHREGSSTWHLRLES